MSTVPDLVERYPGFVDLAIRTRPDVRAYRLSAANTLNAAFAAPTAFLTVQAGTIFQSRSVVRERLGRTQESHRGMTRIQYNPDDFWAGGGTLPHDIDVSYLVVEEQDQAGVFRPEGPILIVPSHGFFNSVQPAMQIVGTAPNVATTTTGVPPVGAMHFVIPRYSTSIAIRNLSAGIPTSLYVSFDTNMPMQEFPNNFADVLQLGTVCDVFLRGEGATANFAIYLAVVNGV